MIYENINNNKETINSVLSQNYKNTEYILVDSNR